MKKCFLSCLKVIGASVVLLSYSGLASADDSLCGLYHEKDKLGKAFTSAKSEHSQEEASKDPDVKDKIKAGFQHCLYASFGIGVSQLEPEGTTNGWRLDDKNSYAVSVGFGWHFAPHWFTEINYNYLGEAGLVHNNPALGEETIDYHTPSWMLGYDVWAESKPFNLYIKAGAAVIENNESADSIDFQSQSDVQAAFGAGVRYRFDNSPWFLGLEYNSYAEDAAVIGLQLSRYFGYSKRNVRYAKTDPVEQNTRAAELRTIGTDTDGDGVADQFDLCPLSKKGEKVDSQGCCVDEQCKVVYP